jgi:hypothetical protein
MGEVPLKPEEQKITMKGYLAHEKPPSLRTLK